MQRLRIERHGPDPVPRPPSPRVIGTVFVSSLASQHLGREQSQLVPAIGLASMAVQAIDHLVIMFPDLETAIRDYTELGFTVVRGGAHPAGTLNAPVAFPDVAEFELITVLA